MKKVIQITEFYEDDRPLSLLLDYDSLPERIQAKVNEALEARDQTIYMACYEDGLQSFRFFDSKVSKKEIVELLGAVTFIDGNDFYVEDYDEDEDEDE